MKAIRYGLTSEEADWVEDVLSNDENSEDLDLVRYFVRGGLTQTQAQSVIHHRGDYMTRIHRKGEGPLWLGQRGPQC